MDKPKEIQDPPQLPQVWEYTDYRSWLTDTFQARKALHSWYSYGVLAQRAGFQARDPGFEIRGGLHSHGNRGDQRHQGGRK